MKTISWILGLLICAIVIGSVVAFKILLAPNTQTPVTTTPLTSNSGSSQGQVNIPSASHSIYLTSDTGAVIKTNDFIQDVTTAKDTVNPGYYYIGSGPNYGGTSSYKIEYVSATQYFNVSLLQEPIGAARQQAEQYLMQKLGISQDQMCHLKYMVSTPAAVDTTYAGIDLGFSFCPDGTKLP